MAAEHAYGPPFDAAGPPPGLDNERAARPRRSDIPSGVGLPFCSELEVEQRLSSWIREGQTDSAVG
eukprot:1225684-Rhodomonas_salina.2